MNNLRYLFNNNMYNLSFYKKSFSCHCKFSQITGEYNLMFQVPAEDFVEQVNDQFNIDTVPFGFLDDFLELGVGSEGLDDGLELIALHEFNKAGKVGTVGQFLVEQSFDLLDGEDGLDVINKTTDTVSSADSHTGWHWQSWQTQEIVESVDNTVHIQTLALESVQELQKNSRVI